MLARIIEFLKAQLNESVSGSRYLYRVGPFAGKKDRWKRIYSWEEHKSKYGFLESPLFKLVFGEKFSPGKFKKEHGEKAALERHVEKLYDNAKISRKFGISVISFRAHFVEYWNNPDKYEPLRKLSSLRGGLTKNETRGRTPPIGERKATRNAQPGKRKETGAIKPSVMRFLANLYGEKVRKAREGITRPAPANRTVTDEQGRNDPGNRPENPLRTPQLPETRHVSGGTNSQLPEQSRPSGGRPVTQTDLGSGGQPGKRPSVNSKKLTQGQIKKIRAEIMALLESKPKPAEGSLQRDRDQFTEGELELLRQYEGAGGTGSDADATQTLYSFFTPESVVDKMWEIGRRYAPPGSHVLDPAAGSGRFAMAGAGYNVDQVEPDPLSARINQILNPDSHVTVGVFQDLFRHPDQNKEIPYNGKPYDLVIGNPPYGTYSGKDKSIIGKDHGRYETLFIEKSLDTLKPGGTLVMLVPRSFMDNTGPAWRKKISEKGKLMDAYRLPNGIFPTTDVGTDIVVIRKEPGDPDQFSGFFFKNKDKILGKDSGKKDRFNRAILGGTVKALERIKPVEPPPASIPEGWKYGFKDSEKRSAALRGNQNARGHKGATGPRQKKSKLDQPEASPAVPAPTLGKKEFNKRFGGGHHPVDAQTFAHTSYDGTFDPQKVEFDPGFHSYINGNYFHDVLYASGNIYDRLDDLARHKDSIIEKYGQNQYDKQKSLLEKALPKRKTLEKVSISPISGFIEDQFKLPNGRDLKSEFWSWAGVKFDPHHYRYDWSGARIAPKDLGPNINFSDLEDYFLRSRVDNLTSKDKDKRDEANRVKTQRREAAERLFNRFLRDGLSPDDRERVETEYNKVFNSHADPDYSRLPVSIDGLATEYKGKALHIPEHQLRLVKFFNQKGSGVGAYGVGLGKTFAGIMATVQNMQMGRCKKPVFLVPKAVYSTWVSEIQSRFPHIPLNELGNLGANSEFDPEIGIPDNTMSIMTYEGLQAISYPDEEIDRMTGDLNDTIRVPDAKHSKFKQAKEDEKASEMVGRGQKGARQSMNIEDLGFDHVTIDESHNFKNLIEKARSYKRGDEDSPDFNEFADISGSSSDRSARLFLLTNHIQHRNNGRNVFMLSATPFANSPIEIYSMLNYVAREDLKRLGFRNVNDFMSAFIELKNEWVVKPGGDVVRKDVVKSFKNVSGLQALIRKHMDFLSANDVGQDLEIPEKIRRVIELEPTEDQRLIMEAAEKIIQANLQPGDTLRGISKMRQATLSPKHALKNEAKALVGNYHFVEDSPKVKFSCDTTAAIYRKRPDVGHILFIPEGTEYFKEVQDYLQKKGIPKEAIRVIEGGTKLDIRDKITESFNRPDGEVKVVIGTEAILEGVNLQGITACSHNLQLPWNPNKMVQFDGRATRQGNRLPFTYSFVPVLNDSVDAAMFQKLDEKGARFNDLMSYRGESETMSVEGVNAEELKFDLIKDPAKLAAFQIRKETEEMEIKKDSLAARAASLRQWKDQHSDASAERDSTQAEIDTLRAQVRQFIPILWETRRQARESKSKKQIEENRKYLKREKEKQIFKPRRAIRKKLRLLEKQQARVDYIESLASGSNLKVSSLEQEALSLEKESKKLETQIEQIKNKKAEYQEKARQRILARAKKAPALDKQVNIAANEVLASLEKINISKSLFSWLWDALAA